MLNIVKSPDPILLKKSQDVDLSDPKLKELSDQMFELMYSYSGIGLAGPQVGINKNIIVMDVCKDLDKGEVEHNPIVVINPKIIKRSKEMEKSQEGCLSCPGITAPVMRHKTVTVEYFDLQGNKQTVQADGLLSFCFQHEIDHLEGKTLFQTSLPESRLQLLKDYQKCLELGIEPGQFMEEDQDQQ